MIHFLRTTFLVLSLTLVLSAPAQSVWSRPHLERVRADIDNPVYARAYRSLLHRADSLLGVAPLSVMAKKKPSPSGNNHDYTSLARYFHPDPDSPDGLPYINRDGITNPEIALYDRVNLGATADRAVTLALAGFFSGDGRYTSKAAELLRVWFLDPATRMNPNLEYAQMVPGVNGGKGRCYGVLDGYSFVPLLDAVALMRGSRFWTEADEQGFREWMGEFLHWLLTSQQGREESAQANNHSTVYDTIVMAVAMYCGRSEVARDIALAVPARRIFTQIEPDGMQPHEMWRTLSFHYSRYNLSHFIDIFMMARKLGLEPDKAEDSRGSSFYKALDLLAGYLGKPASSWPGQQLDGWEAVCKALARDLWRAGTQLDLSRGDYRELYRRYGDSGEPDLFTLLYPDVTAGDGRPVACNINDGWTFHIGDTVKPVHLPHCWNGDAYATRHYYRGQGRYMRCITVPDDFRGKRLYLRFDGAASRSEVYVNGRKAGEHIGAYSPHLLYAGDMLSLSAPNDIEVTVDNSDIDIPPYSADFTFMGGLYRDAWLLALPQVHLDIEGQPECGFRVSCVANEKGWSMHYSATVVNHSDRPADITAQVCVGDPEGAEVARRSMRMRLDAGERREVEFTLDVPEVREWSPESPVLYEVTASLSEGAVIQWRSSCHTAFRTFAFDESGRFLLNGQPYKLRGMCRHQDQYPMGYALSDEQHRRDMRMIKDLGANFVRVSHYPHDEAVLEMCDRLGLIVWEEIPVIDYVPDSDSFADNAETMLLEMIRRDYNHPSVAMWGYMNEILLRTPAQERQAVYERTSRLAERLEAALHREDPHRLSAMAFHGSDVYHRAGLGEISDVKGWNLYQGWYGGELDEFGEFLRRQHSEHPGHRLIVSEYGAGSDLRLHSLSPEPFDFSMEYQQKYLEHYLPVIENSEFVAGASHWNFIDFSSANRAESMPHINNKGLVTNDRRKKDVYHYYRASWTGLPADTVAHIAVRDWPCRTELVGPEGYVVRPVKVYTNLPQVTLQGETRPVKNSNAVFDVKLRPGMNILQATDTAGRVLDVCAVELTALYHDGARLLPSVEELAVNVGSNCYYHSQDSGLDWLPDREYSPGSVYGRIGGEPAATQDEIALTADQPLWQRVLRRPEAYRFDVAPGRYEVELGFVDLASPSGISAYMLGRDAAGGDCAVTDTDVYINGIKVEDRLVPGDIAGCKSIVRRRYVADSRGSLLVSFVPSAGAISSLATIKIRRL